MIARQYSIILLHSLITKIFMLNARSMNLQEQLNKIKNKPQSKKNQQEELQNNQLQLKIGSAIDIPRVQYPVIYISGQTHKQIVKQLNSNVNSASFAINKDDKCFIYPILPAKIAPEYCSVFNSQYTEDDFKKVNKMLIKFNQVTYQLQEVILCPENTSILQYSHLQPYLRQILVNSILNNTQQFYIIVNGRKEYFKIQIIDSQQQCGIVTPSTKLILQTDDKEDHFLLNVKLLVQKYDIDNRYAIIFEKLLINAIYLIASLKQQLNNPIIKELINKFSYNQELKEYIESFHLRKSVHSILLYSLPGMGKSQFFSDLNELLPGFVYFFTQGDIQNQNLIQQLKNVVIIFIDEIDQYSTFQQQIIQQTVFKNCASQLGIQQFIVAATNRKDDIVQTNVLNFDLIQEVTVNLTQIISVIHNILSKYIKLNTQVEELQKNYLSNIKQLSNYLEQYSLADISFIINNLLSTYLLKFQDGSNKRSQQLLLERYEDIDDLFKHIKQNLLHYQPTNLKNYSVAQKSDATIESQFEIAQIQDKVATIQKLLQMKDFSNPILFYGYPGTGKGFSLKILSNTLNLSIMSVSASEIQSPYVGQTEKNLQNIFEVALHYQILFLDEIDILFDHKSQQTSYGQRLLSIISNQLDMQQFLLIGATNRPWAIHPRLLSRFSRKVFFDFLGEKEALTILLKDKISQYFAEELITSLKETMNNVANDGVFDPFVEEDESSSLLQKRTTAELSQLIYKLKLLMVEKQQLYITTDDFTKALRELGNSQITDVEIARFKQFNKDNVVFS